MADLSSIALSGLRASQSSLATTSHNIVNVDTEGYSRQTTGLGTRPAQFSGGSFFGQGVDVNSIARVSNQYVVDQVRRDTSTFNSADAFYDYAVRIDQMLGGDATAITPSLQKFFDSMEGLTNDPSSIASRQALLSSGQALVARFNNVYDQVSQANATLNTELTQITAKINQLSENIASYNKSIQSLSTNNIGEMPNDLLDERDEAVRQLAELVGGEIIQQDDTTISVFVANGQPLVVGGDYFEMQTSEPLSGISRQEITLGKGNNVDNITDLVSGGRLGGLLSVREELIDAVFNEMGRIAMVMSDTFNAQHELGMDLNNELGGEFFSDINGANAGFSRIAPSAMNAGNVSISVTIDDTSLLTVDNYNLRYDAGTGNYTLYNADSSVNASFANPGAGGSFTTADGFTINFGAGVPADGDEFGVLPTRTGAANMGMELNDVRQIAAALPVTTDLPSTNIGTGYVENVVVTDTGAASDFAATPYALTPPYRIEFTSATSYDVINAGTNVAVVSGVAFTPGQSNGLLEQAGLYPASGYDVIYSGSPATNDVVNIRYNNGGVSDNRNALNLSALSDVKTVANGNSTYQSAYAHLVSGVGTRTNDAAVTQEASSTILSQAQTQWESISGVNLDEEAANLMRFQQSYQASARVMQVSSELFDTILGSL
ncbi:MAG: flagellar hook-associated protein FlgK [Ketobacter sp.]